MAKGESKSMEAAVSWVQGLMDHLAKMDGMDGRTARAAAKLLRAGCAYAVHNGNPTWEDNVNAWPGLGMGIALLELCKQCAENAGDPRYSLEDISEEDP